MHVATKVGLLRRKGKPEGLSSSRIREALAESLERLGTDYVDLYYLHAPDPNASVEEILDGLQPLAPNAKLRKKVVRPRQAEVEGPRSEGWGCAKEGSVPRRPRLDWATLQLRTFEADVWQCPCGGRRQVVAVVSQKRTAEEVLRNLGRLPPKPVAQRGQSPPQLALAL